MYSKFPQKTGRVCARVPAPLSKRSLIHLRGRLCLHPLPLDRQGERPNRGYRWGKIPIPNNSNTHTSFGAWRALFTRARDVQTGLPACQVRANAAARESGAAVRARHAPHRPGWPATQHQRPWVGRLRLRLAAHGLCFCFANNLQLTSSQMGERNTPRTSTRQ